MPGHGLITCVSGLHFSFYCLPAVRKMKVWAQVIIIDISYALDSASHPAGERKLKPDRSRILREAAILVVPTERDILGF